MKIHVLILVTLIIGCQIAIGQNIDKTEYRGIFVPVERQINFSEIEGSPYLNEKLIGGMVKFTNGDSVNYFLRYDMYSDEMEYLDKTKLLTINKSLAQNLDHLRLSNDNFVYKEFYIKKNKDEGYLIRLVDDRCKLYKRLTIDFQNAAPTKTGVHEGTPDAFVNKRVLWFYSIDNKPITFFSADNAGLKAIAGSHYEKLKSYTKKERLKIRKEEDLIRWFNYYNSLLDQ